MISTNGTVHEWPMVAVKRCVVLVDYHPLLWCSKFPRVTVKIARQTSVLRYEREIRWLFCN